MRNFSQIYFFVFAALTAAGGIMGYVKAQSLPSLIAGVASGLLLAVSGYLIPSKPTAGSIVGLIVSLMLIGRFLPAYLKKGAVMPAVPIIALSAIGILICAAVLFRR